MTRRDEAQFVDDQQVHPGQLALQVEHRYLVPGPPVVRFASFSPARSPLCGYPAGVLRYHGSAGPPCRLHCRRVRRAGPGQPTALAAEDKNLDLQVERLVLRRYLHRLGHQSSTNATTGSSVSIGATLTSGETLASPAMVGSLGGFDPVDPSPPPRSA